MDFLEPPTPGKPGISDKELDQLSLMFEPPPVKDWRESVPAVSELTRRIRGQLENTFGDVWVRGEISNFRKPVSGHAYFILKDATAQIKGVMFRGSLTKLKFQLQDGAEILLHGKLTVYEPRGEYQIVADTAEPVGIGALQLAFEQMKQKLAKEGLFDPKFKKPLPRLPKTIGIVTSATGAAVKDILKVISRRFPDREIYILPASVQGEKAAGEIVAAIELAERWNQDKSKNPIEVLIVGRGGGSIEDLWPFNEEIVARAIFKCPIPIISAVGHEIDFTIADFVADLRAPTPSAAAEVCIPQKEELATLVKHQMVRLQTVFRKSVERQKLHLGHLANRLVDPRQRILGVKQNLLLVTDKLRKTLEYRLKICRQRLEGRVQMLHSLSPLQVIGRGYSLTQTPEGQIIRSVKEIEPGNTLITRLSDGTVKSQVLPS